MNKLDKELLRLFRELVNRMQPCCENFHHTKAEYHKAGEPCPVEKKFRSILNKE